MYFIAADSTSGVLLRAVQRITAVLAVAPFAIGASPVPRPPRIVSSFTAASATHYPFRQNMYRALQLPDGKIIALSIARQAGQQTMQGRYSTDDGRAWSEAHDLFQWPKNAGGFGLFNAIVDHSGEIHIWVLCDGNSGTLFPKQEEAKPDRPGEILDIWHVRSLNDRKRWDTPKRIWVGRGDDLLSGIQLVSGRLLLPFSFENSRTWENRGGGFFDFTYVGDYSVNVLYSDDDGETWRSSNEDLSVETPDLFTYGANEPVALQLKDGRVWMLIRTERGRFYESFSDDGSKWSRPQPSSLISSDAPAALLRLKDGSILLFSNACLRYPYGYGGRYVLHGAISRDEGKNWLGYREVARDPTRNEPESLQEDYGIGYTFPTLLADGQVLFSNWVEEGTVRNFRLLDPRWIYETRQSADFSNGIEDWSVFGSKGVELESDSSDPRTKVLSVRKANTSWPAGAVWNFPIGARGRLTMQLMLRPGFGGTLVGLTDHFSTPWDMEDQFHNVFNLPISADGQIFPNFKLSANHWLEITLDWDTNSRQCRVLVDGKLAGVVQDNRRSEGLNYLRLRSVSTDPDQGLMLRTVNADVTESWIDSGISY